MMRKLFNKGGLALAFALAGIVLMAGGNPAGMILLVTAAILI
jgi:hypothetical protein